MFICFAACSIQIKHTEGFTEDLKIRLRDHNAGRSSHTKKYRPWELVTYIAFADKQKA